MTKSFATIGFVLLAVGSSACAGAIRTADPYRDDVVKVLETKNGDVTACYNEALKTNKALAGTVTVKFAVEMKTGTFKDIKADGPPELSTCVSNALNGLVLTPGDANHGDATFVYQFTPGAPAAS
jgi:hypothetical protein